MTGLMRELVLRGESRLLLLPWESVLAPGVSKGHEGTGCLASSCQCQYEFEISQSYLPCQITVTRSRSKLPTGELTLPLQLRSDATNKSTFERMECQKMREPGRD